MSKKTTTTTCAETGIVIDTSGAAGDYGSESGDPRGELCLVRRRGNDHWQLEGRDRWREAATLASEWHCTDIVITIYWAAAFVLVDDDVPEIVTAILKYSERLRAIQDGHTVEWDGSNHAGRFDDPASEALAELEALQALEGSIVELPRAWTAADSLNLEELSDKDLGRNAEEFAAEFMEEAESDGIRIFGAPESIVEALKAEREWRAADAEGDKA